MRSLGAVGLQAWLVAALVGVGLAASLAVLLVVLPTLESSVRGNRATREAERLNRELQSPEVVTIVSEVPVVVGAEDLERLATMLRLELGGQVRVVYERGPFLGALAATAPGDAELLRELGREPQPGTAVVGGGRRFVAAASAVQLPSGARARILVAVPVSGVDTDLGIVQQRLIIAVFVVLGLASLAGYLLSRLIGRRISGLAGTAATLAGGDLSARAPELPPREVASLGASLNGMARQLESVVGELTSERDRARGLVASLAEGVLAVSGDGDLLVANAAAQRYLGLPEGRARLDALPAEVMDVVRSGLEGPVESSVEVPLSSGTELEVHLGRLADGGLAVTLRDVTEERGLDRARRDLVANVSHELRTPLAALKGFLELLESDSLDPTTRRQFLDSMSQETERLERLVEEQMQLARLDAGRLPLVREPTDLGQLAREVAGPRRPLAERAGVLLEVRQPGGGPVVVDADVARLEQVLLILLDNALRHTPTGGRVLIGVGRDGQCAAIRVTDDGEGIPDDQQPFVFDRFYRGDTVRSGGRSTGLGLAIARGLVEAHGGTIDVRSAVGRGTTFTILLPGHGA